MCTTRPVLRQTYGYLPSRRTSLPYDWYQIILRADNKFATNRTTGVRALTYVDEVESELIAKRREQVSFQQLSESDSTANQFLSSLSTLTTLSRCFVALRVARPCDIFRETRRLPREKTSTYVR